MATLEEIANNGYVLTPGRYVGIKLDEDEEPFEEKIKRLSDELETLLAEEQNLTGKINEILKALKTLQQVEP